MRAVTAGHAVARGDLGEAMSWPNGVQGELAHRVHLVHAAMPRQRHQ